MVAELVTSRTKKGKWEMSTLLFVIFIVSAASEDRCPAAGAICVCAAAALLYIGRKEGPAATGPDKNK